MYEDIDIIIIQENISYIICMNYVLLYFELKLIFEINVFILYILI